MFSMSSSCWYAYGLEPMFIVSSVASVARQCAIRESVPVRRGPVIRPRASDNVWAVPGD